MVIISGTKAAQKRLGYVADYCGNCLGIRSFDLLAHGIGRHAYYVSTGLTETLGHLKKCRTCHAVTSTSLTRYQKVARKLRDVDALVQETFPDLATAEKDLIQMGHNMKTAATGWKPESRQDYMIAVLERFNPQVEHRYANWSDFDKHSGSGCVLTILLFILFINRGCAAGGQAFTDWFHAAVYTGLTGFVVTCVLACFGPSRFMKREIIPGVAEGLRFMNPTAQEVTAALDRARNLRLKTGRKIRPAALLEALQLTSPVQPQHS